MTQSLSAPSPDDSRLFQWHWAWWFMVAALAAVAAARLHLLNLPLERDEGEYAYAGQLMLQGILPYQLVYTVKLPGTPLAYALIMAAFGETPAGIHFGVLCLTTLTALMLFWLGRKILDSTAGIVAATTYAVLAATPLAFGLAGHAMHFVVFFAIAGLCVLWKARQNLQPSTALMSGVLFGMAILMKQPAALIALWAFASLSHQCMRQSQQPLVKRLWPAAILSLGIALPFGICCLILWHAGVFGKFWFWTFDYARQYALVVPFALGMSFLGSTLVTVIGKQFPLWLIAASGAGLIWLDGRMRPARWWLLGFGLASFAAICPDFYFRNHYFLLLMPAAALLAGCAVSGLCQLLARQTRRFKADEWPLFGFALLTIVAVLVNRGVWFTHTTAQTARAIYQYDCFPEAETVSAFIQKFSAPDTRIAVLGSEPEIYFLSRRHSVTGYIYVYGMMEPQPFARRMQDEMIHNIETGKPRFIVYAENALSWSREKNSDLHIFEWWTSYQTNYTLVGLADVISDTESRYIWGAENATRYGGKLRTGGLEIYRLKTNAPTLAGP